MLEDTNSLDGAQLKEMYYNNTNSSYISSDFYKPRFVIAFIFPSLNPSVCEQFDNFQTTTNKRRQQVKFKITSRNQSDVIAKPATPINNLAARGDISISAKMRKIYVDRKRRLVWIYFICNAQYASFCIFAALDNQFAVLLWKRMVYFMNRRQQKFWLMLLWKDLSDKSIIICRGPHST